MQTIIEIDGESHFDEQWKAYDEERSDILVWLWLKVIRFTNHEVIKDFEEVCKVILQEILDEEAIPPSSRGERGGILNS